MEKDSFRDKSLIVRAGCGYLEFVIVCHFTNSQFRDLGSVKLGFVAEEDLEKGEEIES
jgi:hypothetical protein